MEAGHFGHELPVFYAHVINLFEDSLHPSETAQFAHLALQQISTAPTDPQDATLTTNFLTSLFHASLELTDIPTAFSTLCRHPSPRENLLPTFIRKILDTPATVPTLLTLPFPTHLHDSVDTLLALSQPNDPKILAAWRLHHEDFRGAAAALLPSLKHQHHSMYTGRNRTIKTMIGGSKQPPVTEQTLDETYMTIINLLACVKPEEGWVLVGGSSSGSSENGGNGDANGRRELVTLQDLRTSYQKELDRRSALESGNFAFSTSSGGGGAAEPMDVS